MVDIAAGLLFIVLSDNCKSFIALIISGLLQKISMRESAPISEVCLNNSLFDYNLWVFTNKCAIVNDAIVIYSLLICSWFNYCFFLFIFSVRIINRLRCTCALVGHSWYTNWCYPVNVEYSSDCRWHFMRLFSHRFNSIRPSMSRIMKFVHSKRTN